MRDELAATAIIVAVVWAAALIADRRCHHTALRIRSGRPASEADR